MRLEPENLTCDGELSTSEWKRKEKKLMKDWKRLEKQVGRTVTEEEVLVSMYPQIYGKARWENEEGLPELLTIQIMKGD